MQTLGMNSSDLPGSSSPAAERRQKPRHKIHTPAYARISGESEALLLDLNTILDLNEDGMCVQAPSALGVDHVLQLCLELSEAGGPIYTPGKVVWSNRLGRTGIRFGKLSETSEQQLRRWLFLNAISGCVDTKPTMSDSVPLPDEHENVQAPLEANSALAPIPTITASVGPADHTSMLSALSAVAREAEMLGSNLKAVFDLVSDRALTFSRASGAAIALSNGMDIVCRASAGSDAPSVGASVDADSGFSALCVRNGEMLYCEDSENDLRADRDACRSLGIRSIIAVPIFQESVVVGLIEVFSREPNGFDADAQMVLQTLSEIVAAALARTSYPQRYIKKSSQQSESDGLQTGNVQSDEEHSEISNENLTSQSWFRRALLLLALLTVVLALLWVFLPHKTNPAPPSPNPAESQAVQPTAVAVIPVLLSDQQKLAEQGDTAVQFALAMRYAVGDDTVKQDYTQAARWFSMAAAQGNVHAQSALAAYYLSGIGVPKDLSKAYFWALLAQAGGDESSKYRVQMLASSMDHQQLIAVQEQANRWLKDHQAVASTP
jgi:GAF domain-containing protein